MNRIRPLKIALFSLLLVFPLAGCGGRPPARTAAPPRPPAPSREARAVPPAETAPRLRERTEPPPPKKAPAFEEEAVPPEAEAPGRKQPKRWVAPPPKVPERSRGEIEAALRARPNGPQTDEALYQLAQLHFAEGDYAKAIERIGSLQARFPLSPFYGKGEFLLGLALHARGDYEKAWLPLRGSLSRETDPGRRAVLQAALGGVYEKRNEPFAALLSYAEALANRPGLENASLILDRLRLLAKRGVAAHQLTFAADRFRTPPAGPVLRLAVARRALAENRLQAALAAARRFLKDYPGHPEREEVQALEARLSEQLSVDRGRVGVLLPLSGAAAGAGERVYQGIQLALRHTLSRNPSLRIQLAVRDTRSTPQKPGQASETAAELTGKEKVVALIGPFFTLATEAAAAIAYERKTPLITPFAVRMALRGKNPWVFRNSLTIRLQSQGIAVYAFNELGLRRFAILYPDDRDGREFADYFTEAVLLLGGTVTNRVPFPPNANDFGPQMRALGGLDDAQLRRRRESLGLKRNAPYAPPLPFEAIFIPSYYDKMVLIAPQVPFYNMKGIRLLGTHGWNNPELIKYGERYIEGAVFVDGFYAASEAPRVTKFVTRFKRLFGETPDIFAALGYDTGRIVFEGLARGANTREAMRAYLASLRGFEGVTGLTDMGADGDARRQLFVLSVRKRKILHLQMVTPHRSLEPAAPSSTRRAPEGGAAEGGAPGGLARRPSAP